MLLLPHLLDGGRVLDLWGVVALNDGLHGKGQREACQQTGGGSTRGHSRHTSAAERRPTFGMLDASTLEMPLEVAAGPAAADRLVVAAEDCAACVRALASTNQCQAHQLLSSRRSTSGSCIARVTCERKDRVGLLGSWLLRVQRRCTYGSLKVHFLKKPT